MNNFFKITFITLIILFLGLYLGSFNRDYNNTKAVLTTEAMERFEKDLKEGKVINAKDYIEEEKNYNNKPCQVGRKLSDFIEKSFQKGLKKLVGYLVNMENN